MVAELKMVCVEHKAIQSHTYELVQQIDVIATVCVRVETLAVQE
jgi:hypothetical protein